MRALALQFMKYALAGLAGTLIHTAIFTLLNETILTASAEGLPHERGVNYLLSTLVAFFSAGVFVYLVNRKWVFVADRHSLKKEATLFFAIALCAYLIGAPAGAYFVAFFNWNEYFALLLTIVVSVAINFLGRKLLVFQR